jgi:predicted DsbA family dithiol-disulfide isomerase
MIEIYLFVNPLGRVCLNMEKQVLTLMKQEHKKIQLRLIPLMNLQTISSFMERKKITATDILERNKVTNDVYAASLDFKAAQLQGKKRGRDFLIALQEAVTIKGQNYSAELTLDLFKKVGGDVAMFIEDRASDFVEEAFMADQQVAREMNIKAHPSAVIYNYACDRDYGVLVEDCQTIKEITELCQTNEDGLELFHKQMKQDEHLNQTPFNGANLSLL